MLLLSSLPATEGLVDEMRKRGLLDDRPGGGLMLAADRRSRVEVGIVDPEGGSAMAERREAECALDWLRANAGFLALPWATLAHSQHANLPLLQVASVEALTSLCFMRDSSRAPMRWNVSGVNRACADTMSASPST